MAGGGGNKKRFQYCTDPSGQEILYLRALQGHSGRNPIDPTLFGQCVNSGQFLRVHLSHRMCNQFTLHHEFRIDIGRTKFEQSTDRTVFFLPVDPMDKDREDPHKLELTKPRLASYKQKKWKRLKFYQTRCNAIILHNTLPAYCISKTVVMDSGEIIYETVYVSPRPPPTYFFKDNWVKALDSEVAGSSKDTQRIQPKSTDPIIKNGETCK